MENKDPMEGFVLEMYDPEMLILPRVEKDGKNKAFYNACRYL